MVEVLGIWLNGEDAGQFESGARRHLLRPEMPHGLARKAMA